MANKTLAAIQTAFKPFIQEGYGPKLMEDWDGHDFCILWEEGSPFEWVHMMYGGQDEWGNKVPPANIPATVWTEPVNSCVLALYRN